MIEKAIEVKNLEKSYNKRKAVNNINFIIKAGEIVGLLGPNGCGKTTTIGMMLGLLKPSSGEVFIMGKNIEIEKERINLLSQMNFISPYIELPKKLTVKENLDVYARLYNINNRDDKVYSISKQLRLEKLYNKKTGELSSGQKNRVSLAKALINEPTILLLDEPTASLDPETADFVRSFIEEYSSYKKITILLASHNMNEVERLCARVMMMKNGSIVDSDKPLELIRKHGRKNLEEVFLKIARENNHEY